MMKKNKLISPQSGKLFEEKSFKKIRLYQMDYIFVLCKSERKMENKEMKNIMFQYMTPKMWLFLCFT